MLVEGSRSTEFMKCQQDLYGPGEWVWAPGKSAAAAHVVIEADVARLKGPGPKSKSSRKSGIARSGVCEEENGADSGERWGSNSLDRGRGGGLEHLGMGAADRGSEGVLVGIAVPSACPYGSIVCPGAGGKSNSCASCNRVSFGLPFSKLYGGKGGMVSESKGVFYPAALQRLSSEHAQGALEQARGAGAIGVDESKGCLYPSALARLLGGM